MLMQRILIVVGAILLSVALDLWLIDKVRRQRIRGEGEPAGRPVHKGALGRWVTALRQLLGRLGPLPLAGLGCIVLAQYVIEQRDPLFAALPEIASLNEAWLLQIVNLDNALLALPLFIVGGILLSRVPTAGPGPEKTSAIEWPSLRSMDLRHSIPRFIGSCLLLVFLASTLSKQTYSPAMVILWILALIWLVQIAWRWDRRSGADLSPGLERADLFVLLGLLAFGLAVGSYRLLDIPTSLKGDEGAFWEAARAIARGEVHHALFSPGVYSFPILSSFYQGWVMRLLGINMWGWRFSSVLASVAGVIPLYLLGKEWFDRRVSAVAGIAMLVSPYFLAFARYGYNNSQAIFPVALTAYLWSKGLRQRSMFYCALAGLAAGLGFYTFFAGMLGVVIIATSAIYLMVLRRLPLRSLALACSVAAATWLALVVPRIAYGLGLKTHAMYFKLFETLFVNVEYGRAFFPDAELFRFRPPIEIGGNQLFFEPSLYGLFLTRGVLRTALSFVDPYVVLEHSIASSLAGPVAAFFLVVGLAFACRGWKHYGYALPLVWLVLGSLFLSVIAGHPPRHTHLVAVIPALALLIALGILGTAEILAKTFRRRYDLALHGLTALAVAALAFAGLRQYFIEATQAFLPLTFEQAVDWAAWHADPSVTLAYIEPKADPTEVEYFVNTRLASVKYLKVGLQQLLDGAFTFPDTSRVMAFFADDPDGLIMAQLRRLLPGLSREVTLLSKGNEVIGHAVSTGDFEIQFQPGVATGLTSILRTPVAYLLGVLILGLLALGSRGVRFPVMAFGLRLSVAAQLNPRRLRSERLTREISASGPGSGAPATASDPRSPASGPPSAQPSVKAEPASDGFDFEFKVGIDWPRSKPPKDGGSMPAS